MIKDLKSRAAINSKTNLCMSEPENLSKNTIIPLTLTLCLEEDLSHKSCSLKTLQLSEFVVVLHIKIDWFCKLSKIKKAWRFQYVAKKPKIFHLCSSVQRHIFLIIISGLKEKILLHTATYRMMLGANPSKTHLLLKRSTVQQADQKVSVVFYKLN